MIVQVALPIPVTKTFSYFAPDDWSDILEPYQRVTVPFRGKSAVGYVVGLLWEDMEGLKEVGEVLDPFPLLDANLVRLGLEASEEQVTPQGLVLKYMLPPKTRLNRHLLIGQSSRVRKRHGEPTLTEGIRRMGWLETFRLVRRGDLQLHDRFTGLPFGALCPRSNGRRASRTLLVSGVEGRMARYADEAVTALGSGGNVLMLVPDHHVVGRYVYRYLVGLFPGKVFWYGSAVPYRDRTEAYFRARQNNGIIILGTISCVFLPVKDLALIMVERPQEEDFRNEEGFRFNAVAMAVRRAEIESTGLLIGTPAPTLDLYGKALTGALALEETERPPEPEHHALVVEGRPEAPDAPLEALMPVIESVVGSLGRLAVYTARRDYSGAIKCLACGRPALCPRCEGRLSYQKQRDVLTCRRCGRFFPYEESCRHCGSDLVTFSVAGAEYLEEQLRKRFKGVPVLRATGETVGTEPLQGIADLPGSLIVVGTQALGKLYGFKADALICLGWEELLRVGGFRAEEKVFQLFMNFQDALTPKVLYVAAERKSPWDVGRFLNRSGFYASSLENRKSAGFPPFFRLFLLSWTGSSEKAGEAALKRVGRALEDAGRAGALSGPRVEKKGGVWRWTAIITQPAGASVRQLLALWDVAGVRVEADPPDL